MKESSPDSVGAGLARQIHPLLILRLRGTEEEMGHQHGRILREVGGYEASLAYYPEMPYRMIGGVEPSPRRKLELRAARPAIEYAIGRLDRARPEIYRRRSTAFAEGLGMPPEQARYFLVMDVLQNVISTVGKLGLGPFRHTRNLPVGACTTLMVWGPASADGRLRHARNFDFPGIGVWEKAPAVVFCSPHRGVRYGFATTRGADVPGVTGFNEAGLTITAHTRFHRRFRYNGSAISDLGHEILRKAETLDDAVAVARERPVASTWGIAVSSAWEGRAMVLETNGQTVEVVEPNKGEEFLICANRYQHPRMMAGELAASGAWIDHSLGRCEVGRRTARAGIESGGLTRQDLQAFLGSYEDPDVPGSERAVGSVVAQAIAVQSVVSDGEAKTIDVSLGDCPTGLGPYLAVPWQWDGPDHEMKTVDPADMHADEPLEAPSKSGSRFSGGPSAKAYAHYVEATRIEDDSGGLAEMERALQAAVRADPEEASYRLLTGGTRLRAGDFQGALEEFRAGLAGEKAELRRGQLLLWASRAAHALGLSDEATELRTELLGTAHRLLAEHRHQAKREATRAFPMKRLRAVELNLKLPDLFPPS